MLKDCRKNGFTLLELLVVVLIIGILAGIALPQYNKVVVKSRATAGFNIIKSLKEANERYYLINNQYTRYFHDLDIAVPEGWEYRENDSWDSFCYPSCDDIKQYIDLATTNVTFGLQLKDVSFEILYWFTGTNTQGEFVCFYGNKNIDFYTNICNSLGFNRKKGKMYYYGK